MIDESLSCKFGGGAKNSHNGTTFIRSTNETSAEGHPSSSFFQQSLGSFAVVFTQMIGRLGAIQHDVVSSGVFQRRRISVIKHLLGSQLFDSVNVPWRTCAVHVTPKDFQELDSHRP